MDLSVLANGRRLTNVGTFRAYVVGYLWNHPKINREMTFLVRPLLMQQVLLIIEEQNESKADYSADTLASLVLYATLLFVT